MDTFDLHSLSYVEPVNMNLICCICQTPFVEPTVAKPCGHIFCQTCIAQAIAAKPNCPVDRAPLSSDGKDLQPAPKIVANMVNELVVSCPKSTDGCSHVGQRQLVLHHVKEECAYAWVACTVDGCDEKVRRMDLAQHIETCRARMIRCSMCNEEVRCADAKAHNEICSEQTAIACPHCCTKRPLSQHDTHLDECLEATVSCTHAEHGCMWSGRRCDLASVHIPACPYEPLKEFFARYQQRVKELEHENRQLRADLTTAIESLQGLCEAKAQLGLEPLVAENRRLQNNIESLNAGLADLELQQNTTLMTQSLGMQEELQDLRALCYDLRLQVDHLQRTAGNSDDSVSRGSGNGSGDHSVSAKSADAMQTVMHNWRMSNAVVELTGGRADRHVGFGFQDTGRQHTKL